MGAFRIDERYSFSYADDQLCRCEHEVCQIDRVISFTLRLRAAENEQKERCKEDALRIWHGVFAFNSILQEVQFCDNYSLRLF